MIHFSWALVVLAGAFPQEEAPSNPYCPIMASQPASSAHTLRVYGKTIGFCCRGCLETFAAEPQLYEVALNYTTDESGPRRLLSSPLTIPLALAALSALAALGWKFRRERSSRAVAMAAAFASGLALLATLLFSRWVRVWGADGVNVFSVLGRVIYLGSLLAGVVAGLLVVLPDFRAVLFRPFVRRPWVTAAVFILLLVAGTAAAPWRRSLEAHREQRVHYTTYEEHGRPPSPPAPAADLGFGGAYYRGNDERHTHLFNGGNYRTCTFDLAIEDANGKRLVPGDAVVPGALRLVMGIERAPNTQGELFSASILRRCFLTTNAEPFFMSQDNPAACASFAPRKPDWSWEARIPIGVSGPDAVLQGTVYLREERLLPAPDVAWGIDSFEEWGVKPKYAPGGSRFHYGARYELTIRNGRLQPGSRLLMGSLYRTRRFTVQQLPIEEWFSVRPIPTLPAPNTRRAAAPDTEDF